MAFCSTERCDLKVLVKKGLVMPSSVRAGAGQGFGFSGIWELVILVLSAWLGLPWSSGREVWLPSPLSEKLWGLGLFRTWLSPGFP